MCLIELSLVYKHKLIRCEDVQCRLMRPGLWQMTCKRNTVAELTLKVKMLISISTAIPLITGSRRLKR